MSNEQRARVLVVGCGRMGNSHARAFKAVDDYDVVGLVDRSPEARETLRTLLGGGPATFADMESGLAAVRLDVVAICTLPDSHEALGIRALEAGAHVFLEKPLATTVAGARRVVSAARKRGRKLVVGYILRHHPSWIRFVEVARTLGKPLAMRMNLNQQTQGEAWEAAKGLMRFLSPIADCGVHYVDVMCQMTGAHPQRVSAIGARLSEEIADDMYNYGQLQVAFDDGSVGWYEAGWGPMISETAHFVKDVMGPLGSVSIVAEHAGADADNIEAHTRTGALRVHYAERGANGHFARPDDVIDLHDEPTHDELCRREQRFLLQAIREDLDLTSHLEDAVNSLKIVLAADKSVRTGRTVVLRGR